jgi:DNA polymerase-3 subunit delta'
LIALPSIVPVPPGRDSRLEEERLVPVREFLRTPPLRSRFKVVHVAEADRMNPRAANALLKTLEEPQPHGRLVFHTRSVGRVLPTILSRTLNVPAPLPPEDDLKRAFPEADAEDLDQSQGAPERLEEWMGLGDLRRELFGLFRRVAEMPPAEALHRAEDLRQAADAWSKIARIEPRQAQLRVLERLAWAFSRRAPARPEWVEPTLEIHRRLQQNGNAQVLIDALCAGLATGNLDRLRFR